MFKSAKHRWVRRIAVLATLTIVPATSPAQAQSCFGAQQQTVCKCTSCTYLVFCTFQLGFPSSFLGAQFCTGNNPGFVVLSAAPASSGMTSRTASYGLGCGTANLVGACCGGSRTTTMDGSMYTIMTPSGTVCGAAGTAGSGV